MSAAVDNDVIFKGACYRLLASLVPDSVFGDPVVLGAARYVVRSRIARARLVGSELAQSDAASFFDRATTIEPTDSELRFAGVLEHAAQERGLSLDGGESLLLSAALHREIGYLMTGDKRAIGSIEALLAVEARLTGICGRIVCLEQLVRRLIVEGHFADVRTAICAAAEIDRALSSCFSCTNVPVNEDSVHQGLESYINSLRTCAGRVLSS